MRRRNCPRCVEHDRHGVIARLPVALSLLNAPAGVQVDIAGNRVVLTPDASQPLAQDARVVIRALNAPGLVIDLVFDMFMATQVVRLPVLAR